MSRPRFLILIAGMLVALAALAAPARAANEVATRISIRPMDPVTVGVYLRVTVDLTLASGAPLADQPVTLTKNDEYVHRTRTDLNGIATFRLGKDLAPGEYVLAATYEGETDAYFGATARSTLVVVPFGLTVETVPPLPGMVFELDGTRFVAGDDGVARIAVAVGGVYELAVIEHAYRNPDQRAEFGRWNAEYFGPRISIRIPHDEPLQAGFDVFYRASQIFVDLDGSEVDPSRVTALTLHSSIGAVSTYADGQARWFKASRAVRRPRGLESVEVVYSVQSVEVDGSNVVNSGQQRFLLKANDTWEVELLLFSAHITGSDALFGFPIGQSVDVTYPNGTVVRVEPDENGELWARWLARGNYRMTVADAPGWAPAMPVALSRDQEVQLRVISYLDMGAAALAGLGLALGLLHIGRPHLLPATVADAGRGYGRLVRFSRTLASRLAVSTRTLASRLAVSTRTLASRLAVSTRTLASRLAVSTRTLASRLAVSTRARPPVLISDPTRTGPGARLRSVVGALRRPAMTTPGRRATPRPVRSVTAMSTAATAIPTAVEAPAGANRSRRGSSERAAPRARGAPATEPDGKVTTTVARGTTEAGSPAARNAARRAVTKAVKPATHRVKGSQSDTPTRVTSTATSAKPKAAAAAPKIAVKSTVAPKAAGRGSPRATDAAPTLSASGRVATAVAVKPNGKTRVSGKAAANDKARVSGTARADGKTPASGRVATAVAVKPNGKTRVSGRAAANGKTRVSGRAAANGKARAAGRAAANGKARAAGRAAANGKAPRRTRPARTTAATTRRPRSHGLPAAMSSEAPALIALAIQVKLDQDGPEARQRQLDSLGIDGPGDRPLEDWTVFPGEFAGGAPATAIESCRSCGLPHRVGARFCRRCGQALGEPAPAGPSSNAAASEPSVHQPQRAAGGRKRRVVDGATAHRSSKRAERRRSTRGTA